MRISVSQPVSTPKPAGRRALARAVTDGQRARLWRSGLARHPVRATLNDPADAERRSAEKPSRPRGGAASREHARTGSGGSGGSESARCATVAFVRAASGRSRTRPIRSESRNRRCRRPRTHRRRGARAACDLIERDQASLAPHGAVRTDALRAARGTRRPRLTTRWSP